MEDTRKYEITVDGQVHRVSHENIDKYGWDNYAKNYPGATARMQNAAGEDYDIPLEKAEHFNRNGFNFYFVPDEEPETSEVPMTWDEPWGKPREQGVKEKAKENPPQQASVQVPNSPLQPIEEEPQQTVKPEPVEQEQDATQFRMPTLEESTAQLEKQLNPEDKGEYERIRGEQVAGLAGQIDAALKDARGRSIEQYTSSVEQAQQKGFGASLQEAIGMTAGMASPQDMQVGIARRIAKSEGVPTPEGRALEQEIKSLEAAHRSITEAQRIMDEAARYERAGNLGEWLKQFAGGFSRGFGQKLFDVSTWDMGTSDLEDVTELYKALDAADKGKPLTETQQMLLDAKALEMATTAYFGSYLGRGYKAGVTGGESIPFMVEMAINPASRVGEAATNKLARYAVKRFGKEAAKKVGHKALRATGRAAADVAGAAAMTATTGAIGTAADAVGRMNGQVLFDTDEGGRSFFAGHTEGEDAVTAALKAFGARTIENHSEMVGEYFGPILGKAGKGIRKGLDKVGLEKVNKFIDDVAASDVARLVTDFEKNAKWNGTIGEFAEEIVGGIENALIVGDQSLDSAEGGVFNRDNMIDTFLGVGVMGAIFSTLKTLGYRSPSYRTQKALREIDDAGKVVFRSPESWDRFKSGMDTDPNAALRGILSSDEVTPGERQVAVGYAKAYMEHQGALKAKEKRLSGETSGPLEADAETSFDNGYSLSSQQEMNDAKNMYEYRRQQLKEKVGLEDISDAGVFNTEDLPYSEEEKGCILDYLNAKATYEGMVQRIKDDIDGRIAAASTQVDLNTNAATGRIHPAVTTDDRRVYITGGNVVLNQDGTIDREKSEGDIIIRDADTGAKEFQSVTMLKSVDAPIDPVDEKNTAAEAIRQQIAQTEADKIDGTLPFNPGDNYTLTDQDGVRHTAQAVANEESGAVVNADGTVNVLLDGQPAVMPASQIQQMAEATNLARLAQYEQDREARRTAEVASVREAQRPAYALEDTVTLIGSDGVPVRGSVTAEANEDGQIEVYTEMPINGRKVNLFTPEELDAMLVRHNDEAVETPAAEETLTPSPVETATAPEEQTPVTALSKIPTDDQGNVLFEQAPVQDSYAALLEMNEGDEAETIDTARQMIGNVQKELEKALKQKPKGGATVIDIQRNKAAQKAKVAELQKQLQYWSEVAGYPEAMRRRQAEQDRFQRKMRLAEARKVQETSGRYAKENAALGDPLDFRDYVMRTIATGGIKFKWSDDPSNARRSGLGTHLGLSGSRGEMGRRIWMLSNEDGMYPESAAEELLQGYAETLGANDYTEESTGLTTMDAFNEMLDVLQSYDTPSGMFDAAKKRHQENDPELQMARYAEEAESAEEQAKEQNSNSIGDVINAIVEQGKEYARSIFGQRFFNVVETPDFLKNLGLTGERFTVSYGVLARHFGKDDAHDLTEEEWAQLPDAIQHPFAVSEYYPDGKESGMQRGYRLYTTIKKGNGYIVVGVDVKNMGRDLEINSISTVFSKEGPAGAKENFIYKVENLTPEQEALLNEPNSQSYLPEQELSSEVESVPTIGNGSSTKSVGVNRGNTEGATTTSGNSPATSDNKGTENSGESNAPAENPTVAAIDAARQEVNTEPTDAQKEAGNYKKGHVTIDGHDISIENPKGSIRRGVDADGKPWKNIMFNDYGYIRMTESVDGDHIDIFLSDNPTEGNVFVVDQIDPETGAFDEHKVMYGFATKEDAEYAYRSNYADGWQGLGNITEVKKDEFKKWIASSHRKTKPFAEDKSVKPVEGSGAFEKVKPRIEFWKGKIGRQFHVVGSLEELDVPTRLKVEDAQDEGYSVKGWFDPETSEAYLYVPENATEEDVDRTIMHEVVAHKGMRGLLGGDKYDELCDSVWDDIMTEQEHKIFLDYVGAEEDSPANRRAAADEFIAHLAENINNHEVRTGWDKFMAKVRELLRNLGFDIKVSDLENLLHDSLDRFAMMREAEERRQKALAEKRAEFNGIKADQTVTPAEVKPVKKLNPYNYTFRNAEERTVLSGVYHDGGYAVANDTFILIADKGAYEKKYNGKIIGKKGEVIDGKYPKWREIVPKGGTKVKVDWKDVRAFLEGAKADRAAKWEQLKAAGEKIVSKKEFVESAVVNMNFGNGEVIKFKLPRISQLADYADYIGAKDVELPKNERRAILVRNGKGLSLMMPTLETPSLFGVYAYGETFPEETVRLRKAPNGKDSHLTGRQWRQVRTPEFKKWFGNWEKTTRIEKLRNSTSIQHQFAGEYPLDRKSAKDWMKSNLKGDYTNADTGETITVSNVGINEVFSHGSTDAAHLKSISAIPKLIRDSVFIDEIPNIKDNDKYDNYRYYVCGINIDGEDYTAKVVVGVKGDSRYYDHRLSAIEKGSLIDILNRLSNSVDVTKDPILSGIKDTKLLSILQTDASKVLDENGEPLVVYHGTFDRKADGQFFIFNTPTFFSDDEDTAKIFMRDLANEAMSKMGREIPRPDGAMGYLYPVFLNIRKPLIIDFGGKAWGAENYELTQGSEDAVKSLAKSNEYDGVIVTNIVEGGNARNGHISNTYAVKSPEQIKSATENNGGFDAENPDIRFRKTTPDRKAGHIENVESKREKLLNTAPVPVVENSIVGQTGKEARQNALSWWKSHVPEGERTYDTEIGKVSIDAKSIKASLSHGFSQAKLDAVTSLADGFGQAVYLATIPDYEGNAIENHYFVYPINYHDGLSYVLCRAREDTNLNRLYIHEVFPIQIIKGELHQTAADESQPHRGIALYLDLLREVIGKDTEKSGNSNIAKASEETGKQLGAKVRVIEDVETIRDDNPAKERRMRASKGWYDTRTGEVVIVLPNAASAEDAKATVLHEIVGHKGLRNVVGEKHFRKFIEKVFAGADEATRAKIVAMATRHGWDFRLATEEYIAQLAESGFDERENRNFWQKVRDLFKDMLSAAKIALGFDIDDNDLRYMLWRSYQMQTGKGAFGVAEDVAMQVKMQVGNFREDANNRYKEGQQHPVSTADSGSSSPAYSRPENREAEVILQKNLHDAEFKTGMDTGSHQGDVAKILKNILNTSEITDGNNDDIRYRSAGPTGPTATTARVRYEKAVRTTDRNGRKKRTANLAYRLREAYQDSMLSLKALQDAVLAETGNTLMDNEDAYMAENHMTSMNKDQSEIYMRDYYKPLVKAVAALVKDGADHESIRKYIIAKHGLERNIVFSKRDGERDGKTWDGRIKDYSGLTDLTEDATNFTTIAENMVADFERNHDTADLWEKINAATKETLRKSYESGLMDKATYEKVRGMFDHYIPLRGWDADVAENEYDYLSSNRLMLSPALKKAAGRKSVADDPIATIGNMAESAIIQGNRNLMKQKFLNFVLNNPTSLTSVNEQWYVKDPATGTWEPRNPYIPEDATADEVADIVERFEADMEAERAAGNATKKRGGLNLGKHATKYQGQEHVVRVKRNGKEYCIYINGNPRAAQALNGMTNPDVAKGRLYEGAQAVKHFMARMFTSQNPAFILTNLCRDVIFAGTAVPVKEDAAYAKKYHANILSALAKFKVVNLVHKFEKGTLDTGNEMERYFDEFTRNGGETGFTQLNTVEDFKRDMQKYLKESKGEISSMPKKIWRGIWDSVEFMNRCAEDTTRFIVYMTSRQMGRSVARSVHDAKEITVNFNKKGSGEMGQIVMNFAYIFFNATVQSVANFGKMMYHHPGKTAAALSTFTVAGMLAPILSLAVKAMFGGDDDDTYWDLPEWVRRNNLVLYVPFTDSGYLTIPLPHELRPFYGMGELALSCLMGKEDVDDAVKKAVEGFAGLFPIDWTGNAGSQAVNFTPTIAQPFAQLIKNSDYFGKPIYKRNDYNQLDPEWTKAYTGTNAFLVNATKWLNEQTGGDAVKKGWIDLNPAIIEHLYESYLGGVGKTLNKGAKTMSMLWDSDMREWRNVPVVSSFFQEAEERTTGSRLNREYFDYRDEHEEVEHRLNGYKKQIRMGATEYAEILTEFMQSPEFQRYLKLHGYVEAVSKFNSALKYADKEDREEIETAIRDLKQQLVDELNEEKSNR